MFVAYVNAVKTFGANSMVAGMALNFYIEKKKVNNGFCLVVLITARITLDGVT